MSLLTEDKINACKQYFRKFHKVPRARETMVFKGIEFKIGQFIQCIKRKPGNADIKQELVNIFGQNVLLIGVSKTFSDDEKLEACRLFMNKYNTVPNYIDKIKIHNKMFNIGSFIYMVKCGMYRDLRQEIEQIFHTSLLNTFINDDNDKIDACKEFLNQFGRIPFFDEYIILNGDKFNIGRFVYNARNGMYSDYTKNIVESLFKDKIQTKNIKTDDEILELIKEYYKLDNPPIVYKGLCIKQMIYGIKCGCNYKSIQNEVIKLVNERKRIKDLKFLNLIKNYFDEYKCFPPAELVYKGVKIRYLIIDILRGHRHKSIASEVEQIVQKY